MSKPVTHPGYPAARGRLDADIFADPDREVEWQRGTGVCETKCPIRDIFGKVIEFGLRQPEVVQGQFYAAVARRDWVCFNYFNMEHMDGPTRVIPQQADPVMGEFLLEAAQRFWDEHVVPRVAPDPSEWELLTREDAPKLVEMSGDLAVIEDEEAATLGLSVLDMGAAAKEAKAMYEKLRDGMETVVQDTGHRKIQIPGTGRFTIVQNEGRVGFNQKQLAGHRPIDRDEFLRWLPVGYDPELADDLALDLTRFANRGDPYQFLKATRAGP